MGHWGKSSVSHAKKVPVLATSISTGNEVYFGSAKEAAETLGLHRSQISRAINTPDKKLLVGGFSFKKCYR